MKQEIGLSKESYRMKVMKKYKNYEAGLKVRLADSAYVKEYLTVALEEYEEDDNIEAFCSQSKT